MSAPEDLDPANPKNAAALDALELRVKSGEVRAVRVFARDGRSSTYIVEPWIAQLIAKITKGLPL